MLKGEDVLKLKHLWVETRLTPSEVIAAYILLEDIYQTVCVCAMTRFGMRFAEIMTAAETVKKIQDRGFDFRQFCAILDSEGANNNNNKRKT